MTQINKNNILQYNKATDLINSWYNKYKSQIIMTTSCGITSSVLIDLISKSKCNIPIIFINTGYLFEETIYYFNQLKKLYNNLTFIEIENENINNKIYHNTTNTIIDIINIDECCFDNKVNVLSNYIETHDIKCWISAVRKDQSTVRQLFNESSKTEKGIYKILPILDWTEEEVSDYIKDHSLPIHPLHNHGYNSLGCKPCTHKGKGREGRWKSQDKIECGLHL